MRNYVVIKPSFSDKERTSKRRSVEIVNALGCRCYSIQCCSVSTHSCRRHGYGNDGRSVRRISLHVGITISELNIQLKKFNPKFNSAPARKAKKCAWKGAVWSIIANLLTQIQLLYIGGYVGSRTQQVCNLSWISGLMGTFCKIM